MNKPHVIGLEPWLPQFLAKYSWWTAPVRAEGLAALRIAVASLLIIDALFTYLPNYQLFFGPNSLGGDVFGARLQAPYAFFSVASWLPADSAALFVIGGLVLAALGLLLGIATPYCAALAWMFALTLMNENYYLHNGGDRLKTILLFALIWAPCDATWSWAARQRGDREPTFIFPWALRLLFLQLTILYTMNGVYKIIGPGWADGETLYYVSHDICWSRFPADYLPLPFALTRLVTWTILAWELGFPLLILSRRTRPWALAFGAFFHIASGVTMNICMFPLYALCFYLPELPLAAWRDAWNGKPVAANEPTPAPSAQP